jgi:uncharacterized metal-binding protein
LDEKKMPDLPKKKVGIVACSGEEMPEGTVTRLAALRVLEQLRPADTVTICLPLFLAGGEGDRAFARFYPTIAVDGCEKRCAARGTEKYSGKPAASVVVTDLGAGGDLGSARQLDEAGLRAVDAVAEQVAQTVDELLGLRWDRRRGEVAQVQPQEDSGTKTATCSCGSGIPVQTVLIGDREVTLIALPAIFEQLREAGKPPGDATAAELMQTVRIYNPVPKEQETAYAEAILREYAAFCEEKA